MQIIHGNPLDFPAVLKLKVFLFSSPTLSHDQNWSDYV